MAKLTFKIRKGVSKSAKIQLFFNYGTNKRLRYSTGLEVLDSKNWDSEKMRIKNVLVEVHKNDVNNKLTDIQAFLEKTYTRLSVTENIEVDNEILKTELNSFLNKNKHPEEKTEHLELLPFYKWFINNYQKNPLVTTGQPMAPGTARTYKNGYTLLKKFNDTQFKLNYEKINIDFYDAFLSYMYENEYSLNYIGTQIKILKTIMNASFEKGFHNNLDFTKKYFKKPVEEVNNIYLNQEELQKIFDLDFAEFKPKRINKDFVVTKDKLENARDLFLISANTGLRVSDFNSLTKKNLIIEKGNDYISLTTKKNSKLLTIPINKTVKSILKKGDGKPPKKMPEQHINYCLKVIGELSGINETVQKKITKGGIKKEQEFKKFELISNHTGRRSFCTNAYKSGVPTIDIMAISGHRTERVFYKYIKVDDLERAEKISKHSFFK
ncbi:tyrosine-type recombinase/integrase [Yeosuana sp. MJ-SS3]|uniref:Tyrosine-type recombinase/integrase n=1 Tax=Gilvirhabdus luticola TaxID=3079858 RepID=A0ABU3U476_9FLAO|nr:tyrosine-type recombinase/integrase [Yeosuana sp. MJ-SS3]MDU8885211.1 tyrosine-type recombinase/integrase [Yeosuana sp. MJ-SS3]